MSTEQDSKLKSVPTTVSKSPSSTLTPFYTNMWSFFKKILGALLRSKKSRRPKTIADDDVEQHRPSEESPLLKPCEDIPRSSGRQIIPPFPKNRASRAARIERKAQRERKVFPPVRQRRTLKPGTRFRFEGNQTPHQYSNESAMVLIEDQDGKPCAGIALSMKLSLGMQETLLARRELRLLENRTESQRRFHFALETNIIERMRSLSHELRRLCREDGDNVERINTIKQEIRDNEREHTTLLKKNEELEKGLLEKMKELNRLQEAVDEVLDGVFVNARLLKSTDPHSDVDFIDLGPLPQDDGDKLDVTLDGSSLPSLEINDRFANPSPRDENDDFDRDPTYQADVVDDDDDVSFDEFYDRIVAWSEHVSLPATGAGAEENEAHDREVDNWDVRSVGMMSINSLALGMNRFRIDTYEKMKEIIRANFKRGNEDDKTEINMER